MYLYFFFILILILLVACELGEQVFWKKKKKKHAQNGLPVIMQNLLSFVGKAMFCKSLGSI